MSENFFSLAGPLEVMPTERQMRIANLGAFPYLARDRGIDPRRLLDASFRLSLFFFLANQVLTLRAVHLAARKYHIRDQSHQICEVV